MYASPPASWLTRAGRADRASLGTRLPDDVGVRGHQSGTNTSGKPDSEGTGGEEEALCCPRVVEVESAPLRLPLFSFRAPSTPAHRRPQGVLPCCL